MNILVTGSNGQLGKCLNDLHKFYNSDNWIFCDHEELDITDWYSISNAFIKYNPDIVVNCAAYTNVDKAEEEFLKANEINCIGVQYLLDHCIKHNALLIHISTDYVYKCPEPLYPLYLNSSPLSQSQCEVFSLKETDKCDPLNKYAISKRLGEQICINSTNCIIIRTSWLYSQYGKNFVKTIVNKVKNNEPLKIVCDQFGRPTNANDLAEFIMFGLVIARKFEIGKPCEIYNFQNSGNGCSWYDFGLEIAKIWTYDCGYDISKITSKELNSKTKRPYFSVMDISKASKIMSINDWKSSLRSFLKCYKEIL